MFGYFDANGYVLVMDAEPPRPEGEVNRRKWTACCLAPMLAAGAILLIVAGASLYNSHPSLRKPAAQTTANREEFVRFGRAFFAITTRADKASEQAFKTLQTMVNGNGSIEEVHSAFRTASTANRRASDEFKVLDIPPSLQSQSKLSQSTDTMSKSYYARKVACDILVDWNGDLNDQEIADKYRRQVQDINHLTQEGLSQLADAARDNGVTENDVRKFLPSAIFSEVNPFAAHKIPWRP